MITGRAETKSTNSLLNLIPDLQLAIFEFLTAGKLATISHIHSSLALPPSKTRFLWIKHIKKYFLIADAERDLIENMLTTAQTAADVFKNFLLLSKNHINESHSTHIRIIYDTTFVHKKNMAMTNLIMLINAITKSNSWPAIVRRTLLAAGKKWYTRHKVGLYVSRDRIGEFSLDFHLTLLLAKNEDWTNDFLNKNIFTSTDRLFHLLDCAILKDNLWMKSLVRQKFLPINTVSYKLNSALTVRYNAEFPGDDNIIIPAADALYFYIAKNKKYDQNIRSLFGVFPDKNQQEKILKALCTSEYSLRRISESALKKPLVLNFAHIPCSKKIILDAILGNFSNNVENTSLDICQLYLVFSERIFQKMIVNALLYSKYLWLNLIKTDSDLQLLCDIATNSPLSTERKSLPISSALLAKALVILPHHQEIIFHFFMTKKMWATITIKHIITLLNILPQNKGTIWGKIKNEHYSDLIDKIKHLDDFQALIRNFDITAGSSLWHRNVDNLAMDLLDKLIVKYSVFSTSFLCLNDYYEHWERRVMVKDILLFVVSSSTLIEAIELQDATAISKFLLTFLLNDISAWKIVANISDLIRLFNIFAEHKTMIEEIIRKKPLLLTKIIKNNNDYSLLCAKLPMLEKSAYEIYYYPLVEAPKKLSDADDKRYQDLSALVKKICTSSNNVKHPVIDKLQELDFRFDLEEGYRNDRTEILLGLIAVEYDASIRHQKAVASVKLLWTPVSPLFEQIKTVKAQMLTYLNSIGMQMHYIDDRGKVRETLSKEHLIGIYENFSNAGLAALYRPLETPIRI
jgi:hypothetical protein